MEKNSSWVAIVYPGDRRIRDQATPENNRFAHLFRAFTELGVRAEPAVYHDDFCDEVSEQLLGASAVLVWINPIEGGRDRTKLDGLLREVAASGVFVSAHPDVILKIGTKEVLYRTRHLGWGCVTHLYSSLEQMGRELPARLATGKARVLKQNRGHSGIGVWRVQRVAGKADEMTLETLVRVRHAQRGCVEEVLCLGEFLERCAAYFTGQGRIIDQEYQERLTEGMIRCYLVHDRVAGFGHQAINALYPAPVGGGPEQAPQPGQRYYHPPTVPEFQRLKKQLEQEWVPALQREMSIDREDLPVLWDCDFLLGPQTESGEDSYVLCEINASSVAPFPDSAVPLIVEATVAKIR